MQNENSKKTFYDTNRNKYIANELLYQSEESSISRTSDGNYVRIVRNQENKSEYENRLLWLMRRQNAGDVIKNIIYPQSLLINCKSGEVGYIFSTSKTKSINDLIKRDETEKLYKWYFEKTGGISYRLKIGYLLAKQIIKVHKAGLQFNTLFPEICYIDEYVGEWTKTSSVEVLATENMSSYSRKPIRTKADYYEDPMVTKGIASNSSYSDTYSFAIILFSMLTLCHPFMGEQYYNLNQPEKDIYLRLGMIDYIGDSDGENYSELFEDNRIFVPRELEKLFYKTFKEGKLDISLRPSIQEYADACLKAINTIVRCDSCEKEYFYSSAYHCPFCMHEAVNLVNAKVFTQVIQSKKFLIPEDLLSEETTLPLTEYEVSSLILHEGLNYIPKSCFESNVPVDDNRRMLAVYVNQKNDCYYIYNLLKKITIKVNGRSLAPYEKSKNNRIQLSVKKDLVKIEFPVDANLLTEQRIVEETAVYGKIHIRKIMIIGRGNRA